MPQTRILFKFKDLIFLEAVLDSHQNQEENTKTFQMPSTPARAQPPAVNIPPGGTFVTTKEPVLTHHKGAKSIVYIRLTLGDVHPMGLDRGTMTCMHRDSATQCPHSPKTPLSSACSSPSPHPRQQWFCTLSTVLCSLECHS